MLYGFSEVSKIVVYSMIKGTQLMPKQNKELKIQLQWIIPQLWANLVRQTSISDIWVYHRMFTGVYTCLPLANDFSKTFPKL